MENNIYTVREQIYEGESLSSFLRRISDANGVGFLPFLNDLQTSKSYTQHADIDLLDYCPINTVSITKLSEITKLETTILLRGTFYYLLQLFSVSNDVERSRFVSGILREKVYYCPECIKGKAYYRLIWKVKGVNVCLIHRCRLQSSCIHCGKEIHYRDIQILTLCPYCNGDLRTVLYKKHYDALWNEHAYYYDIWNELLLPRNIKLTPSETALRLLYILNGKQNLFDREQVIKNMKEAGKLPILLQHARNSLAQKRTLHLSFVIEILRENNISLQSFINIQVPQDFIDYINAPIKMRKETVSCFAQWCRNYGIIGSLNKTGTSVKRKTNGGKLSYYLACQECGCEYAFNEDGLLEERTYFIKGYRLLSDKKLQGKGIKAASQYTGMTYNQINRCLAYFYTREKIFNVVKNLLVSKEGSVVEIESSLLERFVRTVISGVAVKEVEKWDCWFDQFHFLAYRYHHRVMQELISLKRPKIKSDEIREIPDIVRKVVKDMIENDIEISARAVAQNVGVSVSTLTNWGCCPFIATAKKNQYVHKMFAKKELILSMVDQYIEGSDGKLMATSLYQHLGVKRSVLWRNAPEITAYITERIKAHNNIRKTSME